MLLQRMLWEETSLMLDIYASFAEDWLAMPVLRGEKTEAERFPGAESTLCIEAMMQDKKALQAGTSHFLGQNFSKACGIKFSGQRRKRRVRMDYILGCFHEIDRWDDYDTFR